MKFIVEIDCDGPAFAGRHIEEVGVVLRRALMLTDKAWFQDEKCCEDETHPRFVRGGSATLTASDGSRVGYVEVCS